TAIGDRSESVGSCQTGEHQGAEHHDCESFRSWPTRSLEHTRLLPRNGNCKATRQSRAGNSHKVSRGQQTTWIETLESSMIWTADVVHRRPRDARLALFVIVVAKANY